MYGNIKLIIMPILSTLYVCEKHEWTHRKLNPPVESNGTWNEMTRLNLNLIKCIHHGWASFQLEISNGIKEPTCDWIPACYQGFFTGVSLMVLSTSAFVIYISGGSRISWGVNSLAEFANLLFTNNCMKMKELWPGGGGVGKARPWRPSPFGSDTVHVFWNCDTVKILLQQNQKCNNVSA